MSQYYFERAVYHYGLGIYGTYGALNMVKTFNQESQFKHTVQSWCHRGYITKKNTDGKYTKEYSSCASVGIREQSFWVCQLNIRWNDRKSILVFGKPYAEVTAEDMKNKNFAPNFSDPYKQADVCIEEWISAQKSWHMPWAAFSNKDKAPILVILNTQT